MINRYKFNSSNLNQLATLEILHAIGKKRGAILKGGIIDVQKVSEIIIQDFRDGMLGLITLETPDDIQIWS